MGDLGARSTARPGETGDERTRAPRLSSQVFAASATLLAVTLGLSILLASRTADEIAERRLSQALEVAPELFHRYEDSLVLALHGAFETRRAEWSLRGRPAPRPDGEEARERAADLAGALGASAVFIYGPDGSLLARSEEGLPAPEPPKPEDPGPGFLLAEDPVPSLFVLVPARLESGATVVAAVRVDESHARGLARVLSAEVAFVGGLGSGPRILSASPGLGGEATRRVVGSVSLESLLTGPSPPAGPERLELFVGHEAFAAVALPLRAGSRARVLLLVARSRAAELAVFSRIRTQLLLLGGLLLLVSIPVGLLLSRRLSRPIERLAAGAEAILSGRLDVTLPEAPVAEVAKLRRGLEALLGEMKERAALEAMLQDLRRPVPGAASSLEPREVSRSTGSRPAPGQVLGGRYEVLELVGEGGMGAVYLARDRALDETLALKVLTASSLDSEAVALLKLELKSARRITHRNVIRVHDFGEHEGWRFLTMEFLRGTTLRQLLDQRRRLDLAPALQLARQMLRGLEAVHEAGVIHQDLKPQNMMVMPNGILKIMDFGIARVAASRDFEDFAVVGTPSYMSPEQVGGGPVDHRSDIYSIGVVLFELFTGQKPFRGVDAADIMERHLSESPPNPGDLRADLPEALGRIVLWCLEKAPMRRPARAADLERALRRVRADEPADPRALAR